jgi:hypothetical protein
MLFLSLDNAIAAISVEKNIIGWIGDGFPTIGAVAIIVYPHQEIVYVARICI